MSVDKEPIENFDNQTDYEAAVLDFLDKEMEAVLPYKQREEPGQEVDELVTDLLKQVITESDQPNGEPRVVSHSLEDVISEFPDAEVEETPPPSENSISSDKAASPPAEARHYSPTKPAPEPLTEARHYGPRKPAPEPPAEVPFNPRMPHFALGMAPRRKAPMIIVASLGLLIAIGTAVYYLWGSSKSEIDTPIYQSASAASLASENLTDMAAPVASQQQYTAETQSLSVARKPADSRLIPLEPNRESSSVPASGTLKASPVQNPATPEPVAPVAADLPANQISNTESMQVIVKPLTTPIQTSSPLAVASNLAIGKPAPPPIPDSIALTSSELERNSTTSVAAILTEIENPAPTSRLQAQALVASRNLVPSTLISQVTPAYPELAIRSRSSGSVILELQINKEGKVVEATPISGPSIFYNEAVKAAMQYRYRPATLDGKNVSSKCRVTMVFNLNS